jgi:hypothetical protein
LGLPDRGRVDPQRLGLDICSGFDPPLSAPAPATVLASLASLTAPSLCSGKKEKHRPRETGALRTEGGGGRRGCLQSSTLLMSNSKLVQQAARFLTQRLEFLLTEYSEARRQDRLQRQHRHMPGQSLSGTTRLIRRRMRRLVPGGFPAGLPLWPGGHRVGLPTSARLGFIRVYA